MKKVAAFIVKFRKYITMIFIGFAVYAAWGWTKTSIEYDLTSYLPTTSDTSKALDIMDDQFYTFGSTYIMVKNVSYDEGEQINDEIASIPGVKYTEFHNTEEYYKDSCAKIHVTFTGTKDSDETLNAYKQIETLLKDYEYYPTTNYDDNYADSLQQSINMVLILAVVVIIIVLLITSESFMEVPVYLLTFGMAALLNMGTNYWLGTISFVSNSVCIILQLALSIDYAIILANHYQEEKMKFSDSKEAMTEALAKSITEISGSSLTTISGLIALCTMSFRLGADLGIVLSKSILFSMLSVFFFMPALLLMFDKPISKTMHKSLVPKISGVGKFCYKTRYVTPVVFLLFAGYTVYVNTQVDYCYDQISIDNSHVSESQKAQQEIDAVFGAENQFAIVMPGNDYDMQADILNMVEEEPNTSKVQGLANTEITNNNITYTLVEKVNYREFAKFMGVSNNLSDQLYRTYAYLSESDSRGSTEQVAIYELDKANYKVSLLDICNLAFDHDDTVKAALAYQPDVLDQYDDVKEQIQDAEKQLVGTEYSRIVFNIDSGRESKETFALIEELQNKIKSKYPDVIFAGDSMADYDTYSSFSMDNMKVSLFTLVFIFVILIFTFNNWFLPIPLCLAIEGAIFINFAFPVWTSTNVFFIVYLIVSAIQMGATIDYAIVITNRYMDLRKQIPDRQKAITESINQAFPTIVTSGTILLVATFIIGILVSDPLISSLGYCLCRGVLISILSAMFVLPCLLVDCDKIFDHTEMRVKVPQVSALKNTFRKASSKALKATTKLATASAITAETTTTTTAEPTDTETTETTSEQQPSSENPIEENTDTNTEEKKEEN
jgi:predicted RND superfamily exporter protein